MSPLTEPTVVALPDPRLLVVTEPTIVALPDPRLLAGTDPNSTESFPRVEPTVMAQPKRRPNKPRLESDGAKTEPFSTITEPMVGLPAGQRGPKAKRPKRERTNGSVSLGKYQLLRPLSSGATSHVFLARYDSDAGSARHLAVKTLRRQHVYDPAHVAAFHDEARLMIALHHRSLAQVFDVALSSDGTHYLAMEYLHGESLAAMVQRARTDGVGIPMDFALTAVTAAASALHHVHERHGGDPRWQSLQHREISPTNLTAVYDGMVKLTSFGSSKAAVRAAITTGEAGSKTKLNYLTPEQALGRPVDARSDVFALGVVLYELTTLTNPFSARTIQELKAKVVRGEPVAPSLLIPGYPHELEQVVMTAMAKSPEHRYQSCAAFSDALIEVGTAFGLMIGPNAIRSALGQLFGGKVEPWLEPSQETPMPVTTVHAAAHQPVSSSQLQTLQTTVPSMPAAVPQAVRNTGSVPVSANVVPRASAMAATQPAPIVTAAQLQQAQAQQAQAQAAAETAMAGSTLPMPAMVSSPNPNRGAPPPAPNVARTMTPSAPPAVARTMSPSAPPMPPSPAVARTLTPGAPPAPPAVARTLTPAAPPAPPAGAKGPPRRTKAPSMALPIAPPVARPVPPSVPAPASSEVRTKAPSAPMPLPPAAARAPAPPLPEAAAPAAPMTSAPSTPLHLPMPAALEAPMPPPALSEVRTKPPSAPMPVGQSPRHKPASAPMPLGRPARTKAPSSVPLPPLPPRAIPEPVAASPSSRVPLPLQAPLQPIVDSPSSRVAPIAVLSNSPSGRVAAPSGPLAELPSAPIARAAAAMPPFAAARPLATEPPPVDKAALSSAPEDDDEIAPPSMPTLRGHEGSPARVKKPQSSALISTDEIHRLVDQAHASAWKESRTHQAQRSAPLAIATPQPHGAAVPARPPMDARVGARVRRAGATGPEAASAWSGMAAPVPTAPSVTAPLVTPVPEEESSGSLRRVLETIAVLATLLLLAIGRPELASVRDSLGLDLTMDGFGATGAQPTTNANAQPTSPATSTQPPTPPVAPATGTEATPAGTTGTTGTPATATGTTTATGTPATATGTGPTTPGTAGTTPTPATGTTTETAPTTATSPALFKLVITSEPPGATVLLDGERLGKTPITAERPKSDGTSVVRLRYRGYQPRKIDIKRSEDVTLDVRLRPAPVEDTGVEGATEATPSPSAEPAPAL